MCGKPPEAMGEASSDGGVSACRSADVALVRPIYQHPDMEPATDASYRTLAYLGDIPTEKVKGIGAVTMGKLAEAGVHSVAHLLMIPPRRYLDRSQMAAIGSAPLGEEITIAGTVAAYSRRRISRGRVMVEARVSDGTGSVRCVWFNPYIRLVDGEEIALSGKLEDFRGSLQMKGPDIDRLDRDGHQTTGRVVPIYPKVANLKHYEVARAIDNALRRSVPIAEIVPFGVLDARNLVDRTFAFSNIHAPSSLDDVVPARRRLVFDEFLRIQMALRVRAHDDFESRAGVSNSVRGTLLHRYLAALPFTLTQDQETALEAIMDDMAAPTPLHRLLQGEVGSGKTVVVIAAMLTSVESGHQAAVMAPTEVLATQHYLGTERSLLEAGLAPSEFTADAMGTVSLFEDPDAPDRPVRIGLFTSARVTCNFTHGDVSREQGLSWLADGTIDIAFGTQALIQPDVDFHSLGITVVDEQHRFGVEQRVILRDRDLGPGVPDLLLMTATPIPRTFVMALYGDLEVSTIRTLPPGRMPTRTDAVVLDGAEPLVDDSIAETVGSGRQVFVVCPLVEDSDTIEARSAAAEYARLTRAIPDAAVGLLHGQMRSDEKADIMERFRAGDIDVLVATTVIEVGIDVPNATLMVIWNAERFGLSQLHQLRGRVGRGSYDGRCLLVADDSTDDAATRIAAMVSTNDGFELAEVDVEVRGAGTIFGAAQSGAGDLRFGDVLRDADLIEMAAEVAREAVDTDRHSPFVDGVMSEVHLFLGDRESWLAKS
jgi:ATP-dependent DNA helicase RecG